MDGFGTGKKGGVSAFFGLKRDKQKSAKASEYVAVEDEEAIDGDQADQALAARLKGGYTVRKYGRKPIPTKKWKRLYATRNVPPLSSATETFVVFSRSSKPVACLTVSRSALTAIFVVDDMTGPLPCQTALAKYLISEGVDISGFEYVLCAFMGGQGLILFDTDIDHAEFEQTLDIHAKFAVRMPQRLVCNRDLVIIGTKIARSPASLIVKGNLVVEDCENMVIPPGTTVGMTMRVRGKTDRLMPHVSVGKDLDISTSEIERLPEELKVGRHIVAVGSRLKTLPEYLHVSGNLSLRGCPIETLPHGLRVDGDLDISGTPVAVISDDIIVGGDLMVDRAFTVDQTVKIGGRILERSEIGGYVARDMGF